MVYFSQLRGMPVMDCEGREVGRLKDFMFVDGMDYAKITHIIYDSPHKERRKISWAYVKELKEEGPKRKCIEFCLNKLKREIIFEDDDEKDMLVSGLIDKQIVDVDGQKIVRVNDILLAKIKAEFCVVAVCVGTRSLLRVLGIKETVVGEERIIAWSAVEALDESLHDLHLKFQKSKIADLHPSDIADIIEDLNPDERVLIFDSLSDKKAARTLAEVEPEVQSSFLRNFKIARIVQMLQNMPSGEAADIISIMPSKKRDSILSSMDQVKASEIREILKYPEESAGSIMHTEFVAIPMNYTAEQTIDYLRKKKPASEKIYHLYVVDNKVRLMGVLSIRALITAEPKKKISTFMRTRIAKIKLGTRKKDITHALTKYNLFALPVTDKKNVLKGVVTADEVLEEIMPASWRKGNLTRNNK